MSVPHRSLGLAWVLVAVLLSTACRKAVENWAPGLTAAERELLLRWLLCDDCGDSVRIRAAALGNRAVPALRNVLAGPPPSWRDDTRLRTARAATRIGRTGSDSAAMVSAAVARFEATVQRRGAVVLGDIRTPAAIAVLRDAIDNAQAREYRDDVIRTIHEALVSVQDPFAGRLSDTTPRFLDTVRIARDPAVDWDGDENVVLLGAPFPDSLVVRRWSVDSLGFVAAGEAGRYALSLVNIGAVQDTARAPLTIRSFPAPPVIGVRDVAAVDLPLVVLRSLSRTSTVIDTVHAYRFRPASDLPLTARVEWRGPAQIETRWIDCIGTSFPGTPGRVSGTVVDEAGNPLGGASVSVVGMALGALTLGDGRFSINVPPAWQGTLRSTRTGYQASVQPAATGRSGYWFAMRSAGPAPSAITPQVNSGSSPNISTHSVPGGSCRVLALIKRDTAVPAVIVRLRLTTS